LELIEIGKIVNTHGIKGEVRVMPWCDSPVQLERFDIFYTKNGSEKLVTQSVRITKGMGIIKFKGYNNPDDAEKLRAQVLYVPKDSFELEDGVFFVRDLIGLKVYDADTEFFYGVITDVIPTGSNDVYTVKSEFREYLVPGIADVVTQTDISEGVMKIRPPEGLF
jgi:16S rRNA processing protein RimM